MEQYSGNYTGPYWSDGKFQESVEFGEAEARSELDSLSRLHDTTYAHYKDRAHREAADLIYEEEAKKLVGKFPSLAGNVVLYGNYTGRQASKLASDLGKFSFIPGLGTVFGLGKFAVENMINSQKMINGTYLKKEKAEVQELYSRDPMRSRKHVTPVNETQGGTGNTTVEKKNTTTPQGKATGSASPNDSLKSKLRAALPKFKPKVSPVKLEPSSDRWTDEQKQSLMEGQARRLRKYNQVRVDAINSTRPGFKEKKKKKKKKNLAYATRIVPEGSY